MIQAGKALYLDDGSDSNCGLLPVVYHGFSALNQNTTEIDQTKAKNSALRAQSKNGIPKEVLREMLPAL
jgi:hypothetical protein